MSNILSDEVAEGQVKKVFIKPHCIHSLGGVEKSKRHLRPITDCSMPDKIGVNNFMNTTCKKFNYKSVDSLAQLVDKNDFMCVTDISSAFRSVFPFSLSIANTRGLVGCVMVRLSTVKKKGCALGSNALHINLTCCPKWGWT